ncbi:MAG TPA: Slp family lipoprotein [Xanthomonadaceae bacterium]|nr:Slp family lipoprotein [Xanthomonadaceae bacterium]
MLAFGGCATVPIPLQGNFSELDQGAATQRDATGESVRWGGTIAEVETLAGETCFQLVGRPLDDETRPIMSDRADARFLACRQGSYEPQVFAKGRSLTVTGRIVGYETRKVGGYDYRQPKVAADVVYLWPKLQQVYVVNDFYPFYPYDPWPSIWRGRRW